MLKYAAMKGIWTTIP